MICDATDIMRGVTLNADICVIGAGAAGVTIALRLIRSGLTVMLLESGGYTPRPDTQALCQGEVSNARLHSPPDRYRRRCLGGSTAIWGGRCVPFDPIDLSYRPYMAHASWPISYETLAS